MITLGYILVKCIRFAIYSLKAFTSILDEALHHSLLTEVVEADFDDPQFNLMNELAKQEARILLAEEPEYF